jgi:hypothetical protein
MKRMMLATMAALLLGGCASSGARDGLVYRDGSWYAPASEGRGDYYTGVERRHDMAYDWPWAWSVGFVPYGGYCPVMYRYCTSFWAGDPFYSGPGYYYPYWYAWHPRGGHRHRSSQEPEETPLAERVSRRHREPGEPRSFRERPLGGAGVGSRRGDEEPPRPRRRVLRSGTNPN